MNWEFYCWCGAAIYGTVCSRIGVGVGDTRAPKTEEVIAHSNKFNRNEII